MNFPSIHRYPDVVVIDTESDSALLDCKRQAVCTKDITVGFELFSDRLNVSVTAQKSPLCYIRLRWNLSFPEGARFLGDDWERAYGSLEWRGMVPNRYFPWYFLGNFEGETAGYGVKVRPGSMCFWQADDEGITLWMDVRNGGSGVLLNGRTLSCADIVCSSESGSTAFEAAHRFCQKMCTDPILPKEPVYGSNNWYYAYGVSSHEEIVADAEYLSMLAGEAKNRPFMVIDDGWQIAHDVDSYNGGPWHTGNEKFPDMAKLAEEIEKRGAKPGIWVRFLLNRDASLPEEWRFEKNHDCLDPSVPEVLAYIKEDVRRIAGWGYKLMKHDFSTYDIFGRWGFQMTPFVTEDGWQFKDRSKTSAEIIINLYRAILEAAGDDMLILGCNCVGHLGAGLMHAQRVGDDTSGVTWERTRKMGINTLAFRLPQHNAFFAVDADCVGIMGPIPWSLNRQWTDLLGRSGTPLFVSAKPGLLKGEEIEELRKALLASSKQEDTAIPLDWMETTTPRRWLINGEEVTYHWNQKQGIVKFNP